MPAVAPPAPHQPDIAVSPVIRALDLPSATSRIHGQKLAATTSGDAPTRPIPVPYARNNAVRLLCFRGEEWKESVRARN